MATHEIDVLIVGAGLAGIGVAYHLQTKCPNKTYAILEARDALGGTWDLFKYPGIRSDSSMPLYAYSFRPWLDERSIAPGELILEYLAATASENGIDKNIRFNTRAKTASWSSETGSWTIECENSETGESDTYVCQWLQMCSGYYSYDKGYTPDIPGLDDFKGELIHPQQWPEDFDARGKRIVVIGSGATAITLIPSLAEKAGHVTMLQRTPTYIHVEPEKDIVAQILRRVFSDETAYKLIRKRNIYLEHVGYKTAKERPDKLKKYLRGRIKKLIPKDVIDQHFTPDYQPWDQRLCVSPGGDLFKAIRAGRASVVTDHIDTITENGIKLQSGDHLDADVIITATGLIMRVGGNIDVQVDGRAFEQKDEWIYKGVMLSNVPNMMLTSGTLIASYTLRVELIADYLCRVLRYLDVTHNRYAMARLPVPREQMPVEPFVSGFSSGYLMRAIETFPKQGAEEPWRNLQTYRDNKRVLEGPVADGVLEFRTCASRPSAEKPQDQARKAG